MSSVTEDLRRLLDERGVKWTSERVSDGVLFTFAKDSRTYSVFARDRAGLEIWSKYLTPEQAIDAMLEPRTCHNEAAPNCRDYWFCCSECEFVAHTNKTAINYCPNCGAKVVSE